MKRKTGKDRVAKFAFGGTPTNPTPVKPASNEIAKANATAKALAARLGLISAEDMHVGDTLPKVLFEGKEIPYGAQIPELTPVSRKFTPVPKDAIDFQYDDNTKQAWYLDPRSGDLVDMDPVNINLPQFKKKTFAEGGEVGMDIAGQGLNLMGALINMLESPNPAAYSKQPIINPSAARSMVSPYAMGGVVPIEAEGGEVIQTPDGEVGKIQGPSHEQGGVDMTVPEGSKIYSDRVTIDGKTMQERKTKRERALKRLNKLMEKNPTDSLLKSTFARTKATLDLEEAQDMEVQNVLNKASNKFATGGAVSGDPINPMFKFMKLSYPYTTEVPSSIEGGVPQINGATDAKAPAIPGTQAAINKAVTDFDLDIDLPHMETGDYIGMAGGLFNAIAPIMNTRNAARATAPNVNRYIGYGKEAIDANDVAQDALAETQSSTNTDIDTTTNTQFARNRNSASSVNTVRALDALTTMGSNRSKVAASDSYNRGLAGLLDKRGAIEMDIDRVVMGGESQRDMADKMDTDNYYSNMADNLVNLGTNIQGIGKTFNVARSNEIDKKLISQLSKYGLTFDKDGNLISTSNG